MKNLIIILVVILMSGCSLQKKSVSTKTAEVKTIDTKTTVSDQSVFTIDTTKVTDLEVIYTKIEYYPPAEPMPEQPSGVSKAAIEPPIKSVETYTIKKKTVNKGESEIQKAIVSDSTSNSTSSINQVTVEKEKPAPDPKRWRYIFYIMLLLAGAFIYLKRSKVGEILKVVLSKIAGFLKI